MATAIELLDFFDDLWEALIPEERVDLLALLIERIEVNQPAKKIKLRLHDLAAPFPPLDDAAGDEA